MLRRTVKLRLALRALRWTIALGGFVVGLVIGLLLWVAL